MGTSGLTVYRESMPIADTEYDPESDDSLVPVIVEALAEATGKDPLELPPLYEHVDAEALNQLFAGHRKTVAGDAVLSFTVEKWNVFVRADGRIRVCDATHRTDPEPVFEANTT